MSGKIPKPAGTFAVITFALPCALWHMHTDAEIQAFVCFALAVIWMAAYIFEKL